MARYSGVVGYSVTKESPANSGIWVEDTEERHYVGTVIKNTSKWESNESVNGNINISNKISIVADAYAFEHFHAIRYISYMGSLWKVVDISVERPRLILSIGGLYNGEQA